MIINVLTLSLRLLISSFLLKLLDPISIFPTLKNVCRSITTLYTVNQKKTWQFIFEYISFLYRFNREEILHATVLKFTTSPDLCVHRTWKN